MQCTVFTLDYMYAGVFRRSDNDVRLCEEVVLYVTKRKHTMLVHSIRLFMLLYNPHFEQIIIKKD